MTTAYGCGGASTPVNHLLGERYNSTHVVKQHTARTACVMVWGHKLCKPAHSNCGTYNLTSQRYFDDIIRPYVAPSLNGLPGAIFQQDNARPQTLVPHMLSNRACVGPAEAPDAAVSLCTVVPPKSGQSRDQKFCPLLGGVRYWGGQPFHKKSFCTSV
ncbi:hypothetical protein AVEN_250551-1 [Araneus ventricosus]|uniref:Uncharacterized protein n=1 Tax=Araneus ventricosus TaxID=182803 RepID=A0A4Y2FTT4_ARAVE|nr:hypothetical protein AVEN_250551-1 [Araneus ventricosus]